jgi:hypothetical protein
MRTHRHEAMRALAAAAALAAALAVAGCERPAKMTECIGNRPAVERTLDVAPPTCDPVLPGTPQPAAPDAPQAAAQG